MKILKYIFVLILLSVVLVLGCLYYAFHIEPYRISVHEYDITEKIVGLEDIKIIQFSDIHIKEDFTSEHLAKVVREINEQNPDIVIFTGDLYDNYANYHEDEKVIEELNKIQANYAKIAIWGNRDQGGGASRNYDFIMEESGFQLLKNEQEVIVLENGKQISVSGLDDSLLGNPYLETMNDYDYDILLSHEPDTVNDYVSFPYEIALSGHSHGGQIDIPFLPFIHERVMETSSLSSMYSGGMYTIDGVLTKLYVNTGIGTTHISARFNVVPEITVFHLYI